MRGAGVIFRADGMLAMQLMQKFTQVVYVMKRILVCSLIKKEFNSLNGILLDGGVEQSLVVRPVLRRSISMRNYAIESSPGS